MLVLLVFLGFLVLWLCFPRVAFTITFAVLVSHFGWVHPFTDVRPMGNMDLFATLIVAVCVIGGFFLDFIEHLKTLELFV